MSHYRSHWRQWAAPIIAEVLLRHPKVNIEQRRALREAYPFGPRKYYPYKVWLDEIQRQRGLKPPIRERRKADAPTPPEQEPGQMDLYESIQQ